FATPADPAACSGTVSCDDVQVDLISFNAPTTVQVGTNASFNWTSRGAWSCSGSGFASTTWNTSGKLPSGSEQVNTTGVALGDYDVVLECSNGPVTDSLTRTVTVDDEIIIPPQCQGREPPAGLTQDTTALSDIFNRTFNDPTIIWDDIFNAPFPDGGSEFWRTDRDQYISLEFTTSGVTNGTRGKLEFVNPQGPSNFGLSLVTFSECPGDFTNQVDPECKKLINNGNIRYAVGENPAFTCELEPNTTYYLNVLHTTDSNAPYQWECGLTPGNPSDTTSCRDLVQATLE
ncbi:MAG: hypothetical protein AAGH65_01030, partial [Pseudomonadota bacterium]